MDKILVIGACGQLGTELTLKLRELFGTDNVVASDLREPAHLIKDGPFESLDVMNKEALDAVIAKNEITEIYHLAAILSAKGEQNPKFAWDLNMTSLLNVLEAGKNGVSKIYWPSSIAVFGPGTPKTKTPQNTVMDPNTVYGISKLAGERWCEWYHQKHGVDVRSIRYPGLIGYKAQPGGGTTDYAVDIFWKAIQDGNYDCFLKQDSLLPMMYMDDAVKATIDIMQADADQIKVRSSYNVSAISFSPAMIYDEIIKRYPDFKIQYSPDFRQQIADSWPNSMDDTEARNDWQWKPDFDLQKMVNTMLDNLEPLLESAK
ncbi:MAG: NAD-dependent epimerase [Flammeovirgaceae bacterium]|nr:NAD-dependent epimerase [Flammeovirgaceae bacterium]MBE63485.1 NAD-dependent epimerase [Flammeovirgaceae bacterium]MBR06894.1 NAD-dependent epimerase [Rickettsiales bacterium]HCX25002.1 NAD-dependent epimerase [Cytophagales bacterium]|tara:strand:+ start:3850 stop:4800 length:951 start_codon:yes stop_codon:yes gene_type:complete